MLELKPERREEAYPIAPPLLSKKKLSPGTTKAYELGISQLKDILLKTIFLTLIKSWWMSFLAVEAERLRVTIRSSV